jgi:hypothetical protein
MGGQGACKASTVSHTRVTEAAKIMARAALGEVNHHRIDLGLWRVVIAWTTTWQREWREVLSCNVSSQ